MKKYLIAFKAQLQSTLEYRGDMAIFAISGAVTPLMGLVIWLSVLGSGANLPLNKPELVLYFLLTSWVSLMTSTWGSWFIAESINNGDYSLYLVKPFSALGNYFANNLAEKAFKLVILTPFLLLVGVIILGNSSVHLSVDITSSFLFLLSLIMGIFIALLLDTCVGLSAFWFHDVDFLNSIVSLGGQLFSGKFIPIIFLPGILFTLTTVLPFRYIISFPVEILLNKLNINSLLIGFTSQIAWLVGLIILYQILLKIGVKSYQGYGA